MQFYVVTDNYISHLKSVDTKVPNNYSAQKPFIGVVLEVGTIKYLAPLTSYKEKQDKLRSSPLFFKIHEDGVETNPLGMVQINNMIPILDSEVTLFDIAVQDIKYQSLLNKQLIFLKKNKDEILKRAKALHQLVAIKNHPHFSRLSCDFKALEDCMKNFNPPAVTITTPPVTTI